MGILKDELQSAVKDLEQPVDMPTGWNKFFKKGRLRCVFIYEDGSYNEIFKKFKKSYFIEYKKKLYQVVPDAIIKGKYPMIMWYYNNPNPIYHSFTNSKLTKEMLNDKSKKFEVQGNQKITASLIIDAEALHSAFTGHVMKGLYGNKINAKALLIIGVFVFVGILIILQLSGQIDILGALGTGAK